MRTVLVIGIGAGDPEHLTLQAITAMNTVDAFFVLEKGAVKDDLVALRRELLARHVTRAHRVVEGSDPDRDRRPADYEGAIAGWHADRAGIVGRMLAEDLGPDEVGAFLVWGDPSLYDSTLRVLDQVRERGGVEFTTRVVPGVTSVHALAAAHRVLLNRVGSPFTVTTGRRLREQLPDVPGDVVVMLDAENTFRLVAEQPDGADFEIFWGAYVGTADELLVGGPLREVVDEIERVRAEGRARKGWIMDTWLLRRRLP